MHDVMVGKKTKFFLPFAWNKGRKKELVGIRLSFSLSARFSLDRKLGRKEAGRRKRERKKRRDIMQSVNIEAAFLHFPPFSSMYLSLSIYVCAKKKKLLSKEEPSKLFCSSLRRYTLCQPGDPVAVAAPVLLLNNRLISEAATHRWSKKFLESFLPHYHSCHKIDNDDDGVALVRWRIFEARAAKEKKTVIVISVRPSVG